MVSSFKIPFSENRSGAPRKPSKLPPTPPKVKSWTRPRTPNQLMSEPVSFLLTGYMAKPTNGLNSSIPVCASHHTLRKAPRSALGAGLLDPLLCPWLPGSHAVGDSVSAPVPWGEDHGTYVEGPL